MRNQEKTFSVKKFLLTILCTIIVSVFIGSTIIYDLESNNVLIPYIIVTAVIYIGNMVRQKILTNKLNKELNKK